MNLYLGLRLTKQLPKTNLWIDFQFRRAADQSAELAALGDADRQARLEYFPGSLKSADTSLFGSIWVWRHSGFDDPLEKLASCPGYTQAIETSNYTGSELRTSVLGL